MVYYNEPNWISIVSLLISLSSVCSSLLLLVLQGEFHGWKFPLWFWLSLATDFVGIFFIVSFAFYTPEIIEYQQYFVTIQSIVLWEFIICIAPFIIVGAVGINIYWIIKKSKNKPWIAILWVPLCTFLMLIGICIASLTMQFFTCWWLGLVVLWIGTSQRVAGIRFDTFYTDIINWIVTESTGIRDDQNDIVLTKHQNKIMKLCIVNKHILQNRWIDNSYERAENYFKAEEKTQFRNVTLRAIRDVFYDDSYEVADLHSWNDNRPSYFLYAWYFVSYGYWFHQYKKEYYQHKRREDMVAVGTLFWLTFITGPFYVISRFFNLMLPMLILLYLYINGGIVLFVDVNGFQIVMWFIYVFMLCVWWLLLILILKEDYYTWHITPTRELFKCNHEYEQVYKRIKNNWFEITNYQVIEKIIFRMCGNDIGGVVMEYCNCIEQSG